MNTKEAIEFKQLVQFCEIELGEHPTEYYDKYFNQIINALKRGEENEKLLNKIKFLAGFNITVDSERNEVVAIIEGSVEKLSKTRCVIKTNRKEDKYLERKK